MSPHGDSPDPHRSGFVLSLRIGANDTIQVAKHADKKDLYVVIHDKGNVPLQLGLNDIIDVLVYDATKFLDEHPGGEEVLLDMAGTCPSRIF